MKIAYLGPVGTYSEQVAQAMYAGVPDADFVLLPTIADAIWAVSDGRADACVVPIENSLEGSVNITADMLAHEVEDLYITAEMALPVRHSLFVANGTTQIDLILSHPQALAQCRHYLDAYYPQAARRPVDSTAQSLEMVAAGPAGWAAVGSSRAGALYGLETAAVDIQDYAENHTRFVRIEKQQCLPTGNGKFKTSVIVLMKGNRPGGLCDILQEFAARNINLTRIESRPARAGLGTYIFFFDMEGSIADPALRETVAAVAGRCEWIKFLGSYPVLEYR